MIKKIRKFEKGNIVKTTEKHDKCLTTLEPISKGVIVGFIKTVPNNPYYVSSVVIISDENKNEHIKNVIWLELHEDNKEINSSFKNEKIPSYQDIILNFDDDEKESTSNNFKI
jgi:hypothetical protein